ncbi:MAG TPA: ABC transporter substrate-binding protein [Treponemataceae bacterium]|nr:ABC transporter substrate-binding protein [Treponemataceae bacterium]
MKSTIIQRMLFPLICTLLIFSCTKKQEVELNQIQKNIIVGFSQIGAESAWRTCNTQSMRDAASASGIQLLYDNAEQKQENQIKAIRSFIVYQVDVIVFVPIVQDGWDNVLREAKDAGIPVIIIDRKMRVADESLFTAYIGADHVEEGRNAARFLLKKFKDENQNYRILEILGTAGSSVADGRYTGFREIINTDKRFTITTSIDGDFLRSRGKEIAETYLMENTKLPFDILYSHNDGMALGFLDVLENTPILPGKDIVIVSVDAEQAAIDALKEGKINCVVECNPKIGDLVIDMVKQLTEGKSIPRVTYVNENVFTEWDDLSLLPLRGY